MAKPKENSSLLVSAVFSCMLSLVIFCMMRFYAEWIVTSQMHVMLIALIGALLFLLALATVSRTVIMVFGSEFHAKFIPDIMACVALAAAAFGVVHRVCTTTWILFGIVAVYVVNRIFNKFIDKASMPEDMSSRKSEKMKKKLKRQRI
ncbi:PREDICTED: protein KRTCAP2 homolog isoform X2 [Rhagoletis zephyria]|uniref:protein KRTCAP2 homolog isoform X2 n=1 Tax=Rhagoletis zephyria TaxID=28612 RepID=UPI0008114D94|nr:PREDICTED: protein KRTCAP2 homolog isoform X2 [Rhagoletis zephyria]XP_036342128.1 protein KRTCAP2 homolog isoform X2 [Rhagoletis pomonella]